MKTLFEATCENRRHIWSLDSYEWLPPPDPRFKADKGDLHHTFAKLAPSLRADIDTVRDYHLRFGINTSDPSSGVSLVKGWFEKTAPWLAERVDKISILRLDGDMYKSTWVVLAALYSKVSLGGWVIVDDYKLRNCRRAIHDWLNCIGFVGKLRMWGTGKPHSKAYWQKTKHQKPGPFCRALRQMHA